MIPAGRLRCARCRQWRPLSRFAAGEGPPSRQGRAWCCAWCAPATERRRERREVPGQSELPLPPPERDPAAVVPAAAALLLGVRLWAARAHFVSPGAEGPRPVREAGPGTVPGAAGSRDPGGAPAPPGSTGCTCNGETP